MTKYTRREFFKSVIPVSVGVVLFLGSDSSISNPNVEMGEVLSIEEYAELMNIRILENSPSAYLDYEIDLVGTRELTENEIECGKELEDLALECLSE